MEPSEIRRRLRAAVEQARQEAAERRGRSDLAARDYETFLAERAVPVFHQVASVLTAEGHPFKVFTPANSVRLAAERSPEEFIELTLDSSLDPPVVMAHVTRGRGRRTIASERPLRSNTPIGELTSEDVLDLLLREVVSFLQR